MQHKVVACFVTQEVAYVGSQWLLSEKGCGKVDDIIVDANLLTLVGVGIIHVVLPKLAICLMEV